MKHTAKRWVITFVCLQLAALAAIAGLVAYTDPYFHYHAPFMEQFFYHLKNQRSQNDGVLKHFDYNAVISGTSMTENFKTSQLDELFGVKSIKVTFSGGSFKEINDNLRTGFTHNPDIKMVVRCLDLALLLTDPNWMRTDLGSYPTYLYNDNPFDDVNYLLNRSIVFEYSLPMISDALAGGASGITDFDSYSNWMPGSTLGSQTVLKGRGPFSAPTQFYELRDAKRAVVQQNITQNVTSLAEEYPDVTFYYFFSPYSAAWWGEVYQKGALEQQLEVEEMYIKAMLEYDNIRLFSFNTFFDITTDLNHYKDTIHYSDWINQEILRFMKDGKGQLTTENYQSYLEEVHEFYSNFDYNSLFEQYDDPTY